MTAPDARAPQLARALAENDRYAAQFDRSSLPLPPGRKLAVLACMDARLTVEDALGLRTGDAHIIRNAGGLATDDAIRSLVISQHLLGTEEVIVVEHTGCGMLTFEDGPVREQIAETTGENLELPPPALRRPRGKPAGPGRTYSIAPVGQERSRQRACVRGGVRTTAPDRLIRPTRKPRRTTP
jgi:hypothetical protein